MAEGEIAKLPSKRKGSVVGEEICGGGSEAFVVG